jgi:hypothetical protein
VLVEPAQQAAIALRAVGQGQRAELAATLVDQRGRVLALVNVYPDEHR